MPSASRVRRDFLEFFAGHGHLIVPSAPVPMPPGSATLFVVAGMVPFMDVFLGTARPPAKRVADTQKCLRVSGKHDDLEEVGRDGYHHTFFEMLGNWSFGDYFKAEAIAYHWELVTKVWGLPKDRLYATVFGGDEVLGIPTDTDTAKLWTEVTDIDPSHVLYDAGVDGNNFWSAGDTGPCGPDTEVHIDLTGDGSGRALVNKDHPDVVELYNLVFIQYNRGPDGALSGLPQRHVDTGMGLERMVRVLSGAQSTYDTDLFTPLLTAIERVTPARRYAGNWNDPVDDAYRIVADHLRALTFTICDGLLPSNQGGGYVLRRILRRAARHGRQHLGAQGPFMHRLVPILVDTMGEAFPELRTDPDHVASVIREEEAAFGRTLDRGIELFEQAAVRSGQRISGADAFKLYDTYGFPLDLTEQMAAERRMSVDVAGYEKLMDEQRERARGAIGEADVRNALAGIAGTLALPDTDFTGYDATSGEYDVSLRVALLEDGTCKPVDKAAPGSAVAVASELTPFYGEAGGQVGDTGTIVAGEATLQVRDTVRTGGVYWHLGVVEGATLRSGRVRARFEVDAGRRRRIMANHTGTHMMNLALRHVLGMHVDQRGSLVDDEKLRFDLSHPEPVRPEAIERVDEHVRADISKALAVYDRVIPLDAALGVRNIRAVFGEKYPPQVRVVSVGVPVDELIAHPSDPRWDEISIELCAGTHLKTSSDAGQFVVVSEEAVAKGVRRLTAFTGRRAAEAVERGQLLLRAASSPDTDPAQLNAAVADQTLPAVVRARLRARVQELQKLRRRQSKASGSARAGELMDAIVALGSGPVLVGRVDAESPRELRAAVEAARSRLSASAVLVAAAAGETVTFVAAVPPKLVDAGLKAGDWVRHAAEAAGGKGGGRPDVAQAGARDPSKLEDALEAARSFAGRRLGASGGQSDPGGI